MKLYTDVGKTENWVLAVEAVGDGRTYGGAAHLSAGYGGIRTNFMDAHFDDHRLIAAHL